MLCGAIQSAVDFARCSMLAVSLPDVSSGDVRWGDFKML
jgi:hypothetical protein